MGQKLTKQQFLEKVKKNVPKKEFDNYDFSQTNFLNINTLVVIICAKHGEFKIFPRNLMYSKNCGCPKCHSKTKKRTTEEFIKEAKKINNNYDYSRVRYINNSTKIEIVCLKHGSFFVPPRDFLNFKSCCPKCRYNNVAFKLSSTTEEFIEKAKLIHGNKYDYSLVNYKNNHSKIKIICPIHGVFEQIPNSHLNGSSCPKCKNSRGEENIAKYLKENNILFEEQKCFKDCRDKRPLPFDFYLPKENLLIEYQGIQHYKNSFGVKKSDWLKYKHHDWLKRKFARKKGYRLITISYKEFNNIERILKEEISDSFSGQF